MSVRGYKRVWIHAHRRRAERCRKQNKTKQNGSIGDPRVAECHVARVLLGSVSSKSKARVTYSCGQIKSGLSI